MTELTTKTMAEAKATFEHVATNHSVTIDHYHSDNGLFEIETMGQALLFWGVNAHH